MEVFADALTKAQRDKLKDSDFALPQKRMFPIHNATHIKMAWDMVDRAKGISDGQRQKRGRTFLRRPKRRKLIRQIGIRRL